MIKNFDEIDREINLFKGGVGFYRWLNRISALKKWSWR